MKIRQFLLWIARVVNYDFCPQLSGVDGLLKHPLGWVISAIVASLLVGLFIGPQGYVLAFSFLALLGFRLGLALAFDERSSLPFDNARSASGGESGTGDGF